MSVLMDNVIPFIKMHGLGNDFVIVDSRDGGPNISADLARSLGDRNYGIGFDQLTIINNSSEADVALKFYNSDGSTAGTCGNATRCVARYEMDRLNLDELSLKTERGILKAYRQGELVSVNMGHPLLEWSDIPLSQPADTLNLPLDGSPTATGMGNPHCTFFVPDAEAVHLETFGPTIENNSLFPDGTNVQIAHIVAKNHLRMRVWERGVGLTLASGSSSCATAVAAVRLGLTGRSVKIELDGGPIHIVWRDDGVWMTGATRHVFNGVLTQQFLDNLR
ncbi:diaminopimelate epimerase [Planktomarina sp.]|nr:diaminopimelate epimerase [Planktomarina sp.]